MNKTMIGAVGLASVIAVLALATPAAAAVDAAGTGTAPFGACDDNYVLVGSAADGVWNFSVALVFDATDPFCVWAETGTFEGAWDPAAGGCIPSVGTPAQELCLENPAGDTYDFQVDMPGYSTGAGSATLNFL